MNKKKNLITNVAASLKLYTTTTKSNIFVNFNANNNKKLLLLPKNVKSNA